MLDSRKETILQLIIEDFIKTAEPVGSKHLADDFGMNVSPATIRNDMAVLEQEGYLRQTHTSSGRVPTEQAYLYYLQNVVQPKCQQNEVDNLRAGMQSSKSIESTLKTIAKQLVDLTGETVILAFDPRWSYYTGVSNLFQKPEFQEDNLFHSISRFVDQFDDVLAQMFEATQEEQMVYIGSRNPFGDQMSTILIRYQVHDSRHGLLGLVGPLRMNYSKNIALMERAKELIGKL
jgi:transcriptional regulator of heat shock response